VRAYHWQGGSRNFGDQITRFILDKLEVKHEWSRVNDADLILVGSILEHLPAGWSGTVCGAGKMYGDTRTDLTAANVVALRGKLTLARVDLRKGVKPVLGDPGLLVPEFVRQPRARFDLGIVPHWSDTDLAKRFPYAHVIDVRGNVQDVVTQIASCKRIISSSLHGLIVADAYGIPRRAELFERAAKEGGDFKFRDYASLFDGDPHFGEFWTAPHHRVARIQRDLRAALGDVVDRPSAGELPAPKRKRRCRKRRPQISLLVPFRDDGEHRSRVWDWLRQYWKANLGSVEIVMGHCGSTPFNKAVAVNDAASRARGRTFVILDADAYLDARVVQDCADILDWAREEGQRTWFMPYTTLYRLSREITVDLVGDSDPRMPYWLPSPIPLSWLENEPTPYGHRHGAMIQIMPREAFFAVGGMDPRFSRGWGSEDSACARALDTLWGPHELTSNDLAHLWHVRPGHDVMTRQWVGQHNSGPAHSRLAQRYADATGEPAFMQGLVDERPKLKPYAWWK
jgi:hypothetical protein